CYFLPGPRPTLIEPGPESCLDRVIAALDEKGVGRDDLANIVVTHVHLDHGGGAGRLAEHFPQATVFVHTQGARHLRSPERLWSSATRVYGEERMEELWGSMWLPSPTAWPGSPTTTTWPRGSLQTSSKPPKSAPSTSQRPQVFSAPTHTPNLGPCCGRRAFSVSRPSGCWLRPWRC